MVVDAVPNTPELICEAILNLIKCYHCDYSLASTIHEENVYTRFKRPFFLNTSQLALINIQEEVSR